ncbi:hypothetical protein E4O05_10040 [Treponema sp. OMZ 787]|uniref:hypothetical protein n=1 Tax=Treponema sp. OMZ 787 TaxID=2563669 RepID=UPI0020A2B8F6|nr:hypothetical protein [Treponema sp. OMZ 787]UTC61860.1 hypothetical protein E4O05_10040 [Treponema sp. OMZ 787]
MRKKMFLFTAVLIAVFLSGCDQNVDTSKKTEKPSIAPPPSSVTKYKITVTQPANGKIDVSPALPTDGKVDKGSELTFKLSANTGYKVKELIIGGITYSDVKDNSIIKKVKIEKNTAVSAVVEAEASQPAEQITIGNSVIYVTKDEGGNIIKASGNITLDKLKELAEKSTNNIVINTNALTIKSFKKENKDFTAYKISKDTLKKAAKALSVLNIENADSTKQAITLDENANIKTISGDISLKDIMKCTNEEITEIAKYIAYNLKEKTEPDFDSTNLKINTFDKKPKGNSENIEWEYISTPITPKFLKETKLNALNKAVLNFKDSNEVMHVKFESYQGDTKEQKQSDYFDINEFSNEIENGKLKNISASDIKGFIFLRGKKEKINGNDNYPEISKLRKISEKLGTKFTVGSVELSGNVGEILQKLINKEILEEETEKSIKFIYDQTLCSTDFYTGYFGTKSNPNLSAKQIQEYYNRSDIMQLDDVTITGLNSENYKGNFIDNMLTNVNFKNSDLSKINFEYCSTGGGYLKFENTILPRTMEGSVIFDLTLRNSKFPDLNLSLGKTIKALPRIKNSLKIYNLKNKLFDNWTKEEIEQFKMKKYGPNEFVGPRYIWEKFPYKKETEFETPTIFIEDNTTDSIQKRQSQLLALLQTQNKSRG